MSEQHTTYFDDSIDVTCGAPNGFDFDWNAHINRYAAMASRLLPHESFTAHLGPGTIMIKRMPWSLYLSIIWNDSSLENVELYLVPKGKDIAAIETTVKNVLIARFLPGANI